MVNKAESPVSAFALVACDRTGRPAGNAGELPEALAKNCAASAEFYERVGFEPPWISYIALSGGKPVGGGAFVGPPRKGRVEIAYFTLKSEQGRGYASKTAAALVDIARTAQPDIVIEAKTLQSINPSTRILERLGFEHAGDVIDEDAGSAWAWQLKPR